MNPIAERVCTRVPKSCTVGCSRGNADTLACSAFATVQSRARFRQSSLRIISQPNEMKRCAFLSVSLLSPAACEVQTLLCCESDFKQKDVCPSVHVSPLFDTFVCSVYSAAVLSSRTECFCLLERFLRDASACLAAVSSFAHCFHATVNFQVFSDLPRFKTRIRV